jgi:hypothetical protein
VPSDAIAGNLAGPLCGRKLRISKCATTISVGLEHADIDDRARRYFARLLLLMQWNVLQAFRSNRLMIGIDLSNEVRRSGCVSGLFRPMSLG